MLRRISRNKSRLEFTLAFATVAATGTDEAFKSWSSVQKKAVQESLKPLVLEDIPLLIAAAKDEGLSAFENR